MAHLKRLRTKKSWPIQRKGITFITKPCPGTHKKEGCLPINVVIKDLLKVSRTTKETKTILNSGKILVDGKKRRDVHFPVGIMDIITIPETKQAFRLMYNKKGRFELQEVPAEKSVEKVRKVVGKHVLKKKKLQLNFYDGHNTIIEKGAYRTGDSVIMKGNKIQKHLKLEKGATVYLVGGNHIGDTGVVKEIKDIKGMEKNRIVIQLGKTDIETLKDYAFVVEEGAKKK